MMASHMSITSSGSIKIIAFLLFLEVSSGHFGLAAVRLLANEPADSYDPSGPIEIYYEASNNKNQEKATPLRDDTYQQQRRKSDFQEANPKRYFFKEVDGDGYAIAKSPERKNYINLRDLLDTIEAGSVYRSGRTLQGPSSSPSSSSSQSSLLLGEPGAPKTATSGANRPLLGFSWTPLRTIQPSSSTSYASNSASGTKSATHPRHASIGRDQLAFNGPSNSITDYEWKRVENTRWNNLRGMWGKRSDPSLTHRAAAYMKGDDDDYNASSGTDKQTATKLAAGQQQKIIE